MPSRATVQPDDQALATHGITDPEAQNDSVLDNQALPLPGSRRSGATSSPLTVSDVLQLQRTIGNHALGRLLAGRVQRKATGEANVQTEGEAPVGRRLRPLVHKDQSAALARQPEETLHPNPSQLTVTGLAVQRVKIAKPAPPPAAGANAHMYLQGMSWHCRAGANHWVYSSTTQSWRKQKQSKVALHNRVNFAVGSGRGAPRQASFRARKGSGASYADAGPRQNRFMRGQRGVIKYQASKKRTYVKNMQAATGTPSATTYATSNGAPAIVGGYNWCHLIGHGGGGSDAAANLVAASTHANSEHLIIERIVYAYKNKGIIVDHRYEPFGGLRIAKTMRYQVLHQNKVIFERLVDGFRATKPDAVELHVVEVKLTAAITEALDEN